MLGHDVAHYLPELRAQAESRMLDTFDINVPSGTAYNPATQSEEPTYALLFATRGRVKVATALNVREAQGGERTIVSVERELHIPVGSPAIPVGAVAVCTFADSTSDPTLLGAALRLEGPAPGSQTTARRMKVTEVIA